MSSQLLIENIKDKIELRFMGYHVEGETVFESMWGMPGVVQMKPFDIDASDISNEDELNKIIKSLINDNGFGCKSIMGAFIVLYANYSNEDVYTGTKIYIKDYYLNKNDVETPQEYIDFAKKTWDEGI